MIPMQQYHIYAAIDVMSVPDDILILYNNFVSIDNLILYNISSRIKQWLKMRRFAGL